MTEQLQSAPSPEQQRIHDVELALLGATIVEASRRSDLLQTVAEHAGATALENSNSIGQTGFFVAGGEVPMQDTNVYRQVGLEAVEDLAQSGIVRNGATARGEEHRRWGDKVFWHPGDATKAMSTGGRIILEADKSSAEASWVTAADVKGVYAKDSDGIVKNIVPSDT